MTEKRALVELSCEGSLEGGKTGTRKRWEKTFGDNGWVHFLDCGDSLKVVYMCQNVLHDIFEICVVSCILIIS